MKNLFPLLALVFILGSCKVSEVVSVETLTNSEMMKAYQTFKMIEDDYSDKRNERLKQMFRDKLIEFGFEEASENPDFLIQGVIVSRDFIKEGGQFYTSSIPGPFYSASNSGNSIPSAGSRGVINRGMIGKVIFLIQDSKTNEIAWMGVSSGVVYGGSRQFELDKMDLVLHQLLTSLY
ncbi:protein of unknown function [Algoriphagus alkaliphilus]|uniref:DUF4136 domain-containing protein n=1 Tax=Algoriphagus alkaliphilus TaxID=279824 RepID=A0A1G5ZLS6_9BACT|nr:DUF4136 domain-containing protein [Algoriphagus alkaliphilus]MBA4299903.1 DUF4136 domain-containing protein [Cyclobacterium sp.]SDA95476.1 protein of unknown function [Algoriphagus alkaliphilus]